MTHSLKIVTKATHKFHGGLHLNDCKAPACDVPLNTCTMPAELVIPLNMHAGVDAEPTVSVGDNVTAWRIIATGVGPVSANIHSPASGVVTHIEPRPMISRSGIEEMAIVIATEAEIESQEPPADWFDELSQPPEAIHAQISGAGIVGLGGAGFPTGTKIASSLDAKTLLINGAECEPYISCDDRTMRELGTEVIAGAFLIAKAAGCDYIQVGIEDNKPEAISKLEAVIQALPGHLQKRISIQVCPTRYPMGGEKQLLETITSNQVPSGTYPAEIGYLVQNVGTALAVYEAVVLNKPLISRIVTMTGKAVSKPGNYRVPIGTPVSHLLKEAGVNTSECHQLIHGGPMMGYPLADQDRPISKLTNCLIAATVDEIPELPTEQPCIRCGQCAEVCPAKLLPQQLLWFSKSEELEKAEQFKINDCIECGLCAYVCPSHIPLVDYYRFTKSEIRIQTRDRLKAERSKVKFDARNERIEQERLEKERIKAEKAAARAAKKAAGGDDATDQAKKDAVAAALARVKAKKKEQGDSES